MPKAITVLENGYLDLDPMVTHYLSLDEISKGVELMKSGEGMEIIIQIAQEEK
jgi:S-(hydroxymethyl)glutathione dehydrogenase/alcohol dehydrogenase